jgi:hypothetical protein
VAGIDINIIGWILMGAGVIGLILTLVVLAPRRRRTVTEPQTAATLAAPDTSRRATRAVVDQHVSGELR